LSLEFRYRTEFIREYLQEQNILYYICPKFCYFLPVDFPAKLEIKRTSNLETYLHTLHKASNYSIRVLAYTATGDGLASHPLFCQTDDDVPDAPAAIKAAALTADSILISWLTPKNRNGIISHYTVYSREAGRKGQAKSKFQRNGAQRAALKCIRTFNFFARSSSHGACRRERLSGDIRVTQPGRKSNVRILGFGFDIRGRRGAHICDRPGHQYAR